MSAVVRLKRLLDEEPLEAIVINCKRRKTDKHKLENQEDDLSTIFKFVGTVTNPDEDISAHIKRSLKVETEDEYKKHNVDIITKLREDTQEASKANRYKVINSCRFGDLEENASVDNDSLDVNSSYTVFDVEINEDNNTQNETKPSISEPRYVYDLYYTNSDDFGDAEINEFINVYPLSDQLVYGSHRDNGLSDSYDSEDSNAENNWRNDYPDESDMESINDEDMIQAVKRMNVDEESDLSSDDGEEEYAYNTNYDDTSLDDTVDENDVKQYGKMYARFKARAKKLAEPDDIDHGLYYGDIGDDEEYYND